VSWSHYPNRVQELGDRYYPVNKHVKIRYTL
ncbi:hypothetical protein, partial [Escherichia coli]